MLLADGPDVVRQLAVGLATGLFLFLLVRFSSVSGVQVVTAMLIATAGELFLSLVWGLYTYHWAAVPYYVPFGHGIFYGLAAESSRQAWLRKYEPLVVRIALLSGTAIAIASLGTAKDTWGGLWWIGAALLISQNRSRLLFSMCFFYTMILEWIGTAIGNWQWAADVPFLHFTSANPPSGVGILYCLLDLFTVSVCATAFVERMAGKTAAPREKLCELEAA